MKEDTLDITRTDDLAIIRMLVNRAPDNKTTTGSYSFKFKGMVGTIEPKTPRVPDDVVNDYKNFARRMREAGLTSVHLDNQPDASHLMISRDDMEQMRALALKSRSAARQEMAL